MDDRMPEDFASGGRVPFSKGKFGEWTGKGLAALIEKLFPGTTKIGQRSKPFPGKVQKTMDLRKSLADFKKREEAAKSKKLIDEDIKLIAKEQDLDEKSVRRIWDDHIADEGGIGSLDEFHADFVKETGINISKDNLRKAWRMKRSYPFNTPIVDKTGKDIGGEATQKMYPGSKKFIVSDEDKLTKEIDFMRGENKIISHAGDAPKAGEGRFTKAEVMIMRLENTIKAEKKRKKQDETSKYVLETYPNWIKEIKANPELANNQNVWDNLMTDLPKNQQFVVYGDDTVDFFTQSKFGPHNIASKKAFHKKHPYLTEKEAIKISTMEPTDQVMELKRLQTIRKKSMHASGGLAGMLGE
jgi:hypothetical protein